MTQRRRILFLNRCYWPDVEATGQLLTDLCEQLAVDFDVHVVCGQPNRTTHDANDDRQESSSRAGVTIHRLQHFQFPKRFSAARIINLVSFYRAAKRYMKQSRLSADVIVSETDPFLLPLAGDYASTRLNAHHVCYLQDIYPDVAEAVGKSTIPGVAKFLRSRLRRTYLRADRVIVLGECMLRRLTTEPWGLSAGSIEVIPNWADCEAIKPIPHAKNEFRQQQELGDRFVVMHSGNMGLTQRLDVLLQAAVHPDWPERAKLLLVGGGASEHSLRKLAENLLPAGSQQDRIEFLPYRKRSELSQSLSAADLHIVSMHQNIAGCLCPSKLYGILAAGRPILAIADEQTDLSQTILRHDLGWCCPPGDPGEIARRVRHAMKERCETRNQRARKIATEHYDRDVIVAKFKTLFNSLLKGQPEGSLPAESADELSAAPSEVDSSELVPNKSVF